MKKLIAFIGATFMVALVTLISVPASSYAANYAYVDRVGEVKMFVADTANIALRDAPNMDVHSGVILLNTAQNISLVGTNL